MRFFARSSFASSFCTLAAGTAIAALAGGGCLQILGLDGYKEGGGGSAATGSSTSTTSPTSTGTMSTSASTGGAGGGVPADCTAQGSIVDVMTRPDLSTRDLAMDFAPLNHVTYFATSYGSSGSPSVGGVIVNTVSDNGNVGTPQTYEIQNSGVTVSGIKLTPTDLIVYARLGGQIGEVHFRMNVAPTFAPFADILDPACTSPNFISDFQMQQPIDAASPRWVAVCRDQAGGLEKMFMGNATVSQLISQETLGEPADKLQSYIGLAGAHQMIFAGGDPMSGAWYRSGTTAAELSVKRTIEAESDPARSTLSMAQVPDGNGGIQVFVATLQNANITPARLFVMGAPPNNLTQLSMKPPPGLKKIADITMLGQLGGFSPVFVTPGRLAGAGATVDKKNVLFTFMRSDGTILTRPLVRQADPGLSIDQATSVPVGVPSYMVGWSEGNQASQTIHAQTMLCVGGG